MVKVGQNAMTLTQKLVKTIPEKEHIWISLTGGGGKTSLMQALAKEYKSCGKHVLMTTTTRIQNKLSYKWSCDYYFTNETSVLSHFCSEPEVVLYAEDCYDIKKLIKPREEILKVLYHKFDVVICESDGSRQLPLKIYSDRDPVIMSWNDFTICVAGMWSAGDKRSNQTMNCDDERPVDGAFIDSLIASPQGFFKDSQVGKRCVLLNGSDVCNEEQTNVFLNRQWPSDCVIIAGSVLKNELL